MITPIILSLNLVSQDCKLQCNNFSAADSTSLILVNIQQQTAYVFTKYRKSGTSWMWHQRPQNTV